MSAELDRLRQREIELQTEVNRLEVELEAAVNYESFEEADIIEDDLFTADHELMSLRAEIARMERSEAGFISA